MNSSIEFRLNVQTYIKCSYHSSDFKLIISVNLRSISKLSENIIYEIEENILPWDELNSRIKTDIQIEKFQNRIKKEVNFFTLLTLLACLFRYKLT